MSKKRVAILGAGVFGLANAWAASKRGFEVTVFEKDPFAIGASVRNFGMIWPIGQRVGESYRLAIESRRLWLELCREAGIWIRECGSIHLAHRDDEFAVLEEFCGQSEELGVDCELLSRREVMAKSSAANESGLLGGMWSPNECCVNPRKVIASLPGWLERTYGVHFHFDTYIHSIHSGSGAIELGTSSDGTHSFDQVIVCAGADINRLFPDATNSPVKACKLQMLKTVPQPNTFEVGPHLAGGLTLRHYRNFECCPSLPALRSRIASETPELDAYGVHVMIAQNDDGEVVLGDSHEYGAAITPFDQTAIDDLILRELRKIVRIPEWRIQERWHGVYVKHPDQPVVLSEPQPNIYLFAATGGTGMTLSMALAEQFWSDEVVD
jgi:FAD dependent oxidoreductase TIGR03364